MGYKILLFDIENAPSLAYIWSLYNEVSSTDFIKEDWYIMCWAAKWLGEKKVYSSALPDNKSYKTNPSDDKHVVKALWELLNEADIVIAHNGRDFDRRKFNARCLYHNLPPVSPYRMIDTLLVSRKHFMFTSNRLGDLGKALGLGNKLDTGGFKLWKQCMSGDKKAWNKMVKYCKGDVILLEKVYEKLRPYIVRHPVLSTFTGGGTHTCPRCGSENVQCRGFVYTNTGKYQRFCCNECGGWARERKSVMEEKVQLVGA